MQSYNTLVLSGGAIKGVCLLGSLHYLHKKNYLQNIKYYCGSSIGSIVAFLLLIGYEPLELLQYICINKIFEKELFFDVFSMMKGEGAVEYSKFNDILERLIIKKIGTLPSLGLVEREFEKEIIMSTYNYTKQKIEYITSKTHPDMNCLIAMRLSCNLPLIFSKYEYMNSQYLDSGILNLFPINYFTEEKYKIIGISLFGNALDEYNSPPPPNFDDESIISYIYNLISVPIREIFKRDVENYQNSRQHILIHIRNIEIFTWKYHMNSVNLLNLFSEGYKQTAEILD